MLFALQDTSGYSVDAPQIVIEPPNQNAALKNSLDAQMQSLRLGHDDDAIGMSGEHAKLSTRQRCDTSVMTSYCESHVVICCLEHPLRK